MSSLISVILGAAWISSTLPPRVLPEEQRSRFPAHTARKPHRSTGLSERNVTPPRIPGARRVVGQARLFSRREPWSNPRRQQVRENLEIVGLRKVDPLTHEESLEVLLDRLLRVETHCVGWAFSSQLERIRGVLQVVLGLGDPFV